METLLLLSFFLPIVYFLFIVLAPLFIIWGGLKIFNIQGIPKRKIIIYLIVFVLAFFCVDNFFGPRAGISLAYLGIQIIDNLIYLAINFLLLKYYFHLFGKKLYLFLVYLIVANYIFTVVGHLLTAIL